MNVAILFNAAEGGKQGTDALFAGTELYSYSLKTFYLHPCIDCIAVMWCGSETMVNAREYIENWKTEYGIDKPVWVYQQSRNIQQVLGRIEEGDGRCVELYVLHDVRYPFVKASMIYSVAEKAALCGIAVAADEVKDDLVVCSGTQEIGVKSVRYAKYPAAIRAEHEVLGDLEGIAEVLEKCLECKPYLCNFKDGNLFIGTWENKEMAEAILRRSEIGGLCDKNY